MCIKYLFEVYTDERADIKRNVSLGQLRLGSQSVLLLFLSAFSLSQLQSTKAAVRKCLSQIQRCSKVILVSGFNSVIGLPLQMITSITSSTSHSFSPHIFLLNLLNGPLDLCFQILLFCWNLDRTCPCFVLETSHLQHLPYSKWTMMRKSCPEYPVFFYCIILLHKKKLLREMDSLVIVY